MAAKPVNTMKKINITIIHFEQADQDFNRWEIDSEGIVISSHPCQGLIWGGCRVLNLTELKLGAMEVIEIKYRLLKVETRPAKFAIQLTKLVKADNQPVFYRTTKAHATKYFDKAQVFETYDAAFKVFRSTGQKIIEL
jgi:hypothetical protein